MNEGGVERGLERGGPPQAGAVKEGVDEKREERPPLVRGSGRGDEEAIEGGGVDGVKEVMENGERRRRRTVKS